MNAKLPLILPALRAGFGDWVFYSTLMCLSDIGDRVDYAEAIHPSKALSELIQRSLEGKRASHIANYLLKNEQRFFNSLVLATYDGDPEWLEIGGLKTEDKNLLKELSDEAKDAIGFLRLGGAEKIFALDGQHRLAGIKKALEVSKKIGEERLSVIFVAHRKSKAGLQRTRRLFTTLNKTAKPVLKSDIIALDEDDSMAIVARQLVETNDRFKDPRIAVIAGAAIPSGNNVCLATISGLYDILKLLFIDKFGKRNSDATLRFERPNDEILEQYYAYAQEYFESLGKAFKPIQEFYDAADPASVTRKQRGSFGGHLLFRTIGLDSFTRTAIAFGKQNAIGLSAAVEALNTLPTNIAEPPYARLVWDVASKRMILKNKTLLRDLLFFLCGLDVDQAELFGRYAELTEQSEQLVKRELADLRIV